MSDRLRTPFLFLALIFAGLAVLVEIGGAFFLQVPPPPGNAPSNLEGLTPSEAFELQDALSQATAPRDTPPGFAIAALAYVDGLLFLTLLLVAMPIIIGDRIHGRTQGIISVVAGFLILLATFRNLFVLLIELTIRLTLFLAVPFGTIAYMALYAAFDRSGAAVVLALVLFLELAAGVCVLLAHQRFLRQYGLLLMYATAIVSSIIISFLHGLVPRFLVSITDVIAAIIVDILALIWAIVFLIFGIIAVIKAIRFGKRQQDAPDNRAERGTGSQPVRAG